MNRGEIRTNMGYYLDDDSNDVWSVTEKDYYIMEAYRHYYGELVKYGYPGMATTDSLTITASTETVALPSDFFKLRNIYRVLSSNIRVPMVEEQGYGTNNYLPGSAINYGNYYIPAFKILGSSLYLNPVPLQTFTDGIYIEYYQNLDDWTSDGDEPVFSTQWHNLIVLKAAMEAKGGREDANTSNLERQLARSEENFYYDISSMTESRQEVEPFMP